MRTRLRGCCLTILSECFSRDLSVRDHEIVMLAVCTLGMHYVIRTIYRRSSYIYFKSAFSYNVPETTTHRYKEKHPELLLSNRETEN